MKLPTYRLQIDWRVALGQVFLTALGVALALAGGAWWTHHQERVREISDLHVALETARTNEKRLRQAVYEDSISFALARRVRHWLDGTEVIPADSVAEVVINTAWWSDSRPMMGPFEMIVHSGDINLVQDKRLRALLPSYLGEIQNRMEDLRLIDNAFIVGNRDPSNLPEYRAVDAAAAPSASAVEALRKQPQLYLDTNKVINLLGNALGYYRLMLRNTTEVRLALENYLGEKPITYPAPRLLRDSF